MGWRSVVISRPARLRREHGSLLIEQQQTARIPFEDIAVIVLDNREIALTHPVLAACAEHGIALYSTGENHLPNGVLLPFLPHSRSTRMLRQQLALGKPATKRAHARIVQAKIRNQARCMALLEHADGTHLESLARRVRSGDGGNLEAQASAWYFPRIFGKGFTRTQESWTNAALNYGYTVLRGACARALVQHGMLPALGLFHASEQNAFNLADDLMEPFRPVVDLHVARQCQNSSERGTLCPADKAALVALLNVDVSMPRGNMNVLAAIEQAAESLARLFAEGSEQLLELPELTGLQQHQFEM